MTQPATSHHLSTRAERASLQALDRAALERHQLVRLNQLLAEMLPHNRFYAEKLGGSRQLKSLAELASLPFTFKDELAAGRDAQRWTANQTWPLDRYSRFHQTSGTRGRPMMVLDTAEDWHWWRDVWQYVFDSADIAPGDRLLMAFSFGPFIGFWSAFDAALARGCLVIPGGGMSSLQRLELLRQTRAAALFCTPSYALHLAEVAAEHQIVPSELELKSLVLAGEPGGSIPAVRQRIESAWQARVVDHCGASEVGAWGVGDREGRGLYITESHFVAEFLSLETGQAAAEGELSELVLTSLGRVGCPVIRYRTGDLVRPCWKQPGDCRFVFLDGGVIGRSDDMIIVRGVNIFPSSVEQIVRSFPEVVEYRLIISKAAEMDQLRVQIEDRLEQPHRVAEELRLRLGLKVAVECVPLGSLPRFEGKGRRLIDQRAGNGV